MMWHFPMFWVVMLLFWLMASRRRRWRPRWVMVPPGWYPPAAWMPYEDDRAAALPPSRLTRRRARVEGDAQQEEETRAREVEALETRIAELEQRLDFTERLLATRAEQRPGNAPDA